MSRDIRSSTQIRQEFLDFFKSKQHTIVPSSSLLPDSPNLLFTNAGMNQFVPIFLGREKSPYQPGRAADTQKCIRAGGKHNDLDDVGLDTYHHTFFEMLGNWSFGDYFKKEAIDWAWELVTGVWGFPKNRVYATIYKPDPTKGDPSELDQEAYNFWSAKFSAAGLDPEIHIVYGGKKDNFWMMGETGPCGPCSELHIDLTPHGDTLGKLVNQGSPQCIEIWNLVFIQFNANPDGTFSPLPARHVDTGMGFERVTSILQCTRNFTDFNGAISNYETDIFRPIFDRIEQLSGKRYGSTLPKPGSTGDTEQERIDVAFRVIADHIRTLSFAIADGILPGNNDRNYVLRRILRRAIRYGRSLGMHEPFFYKLSNVLAETMGGIFPEVRGKLSHVETVIRAEEEAFNKTLDRGLDLFNEEVGKLKSTEFSGDFAFKLYDTYGFPLDLTELMAREKGLSVDVAGFHTLMDEQRARARAAQKREVITASTADAFKPTQFIGYETLTTEAELLETVDIKGKAAVLADRSCFYAEMGGQLGDTGTLHQGAQQWRITNTQKAGAAFLHFLEEGDLPKIGEKITLEVDRSRRHAIQRHHTVTHLLHWALHEVASKEATQKGSFVGPDKLTFDFNAAPLTPQQLSDIERLVNERILENDPVWWTEVSHAEVKGRADVMQVFGDKYGDKVRVVQIGGQAAKLDGFSMELCGGTHTRATGEIGLFRIVSEAAVAAGVRRIEAVAGLHSYGQVLETNHLLGRIAGKLNAPASDIEKKLDAFLARQKDLERKLKSFEQKDAGDRAKQLSQCARNIGTIKAVIENLGSVTPDQLQLIADSLKMQVEAVIVLAGVDNGAVSILATVPPSLTQRAQAGKIVQLMAPIVGGKGGGKPDFARGGGKEVTKVADALAKAEEFLRG